MAPPDELLTKARAWATDDPDPTTAAELNALVEQVEGGDEAARADLADRFDGTLEFGTAGLRGALGAGPNRMNRVVVLRAAAGLASYLLDVVGEGSGEPATVVIGYDARHLSDVFARGTAEVMTGAGLRAVVLPRPLPTPVLAFAIRELRCVAGVMVTASHNPPQDNGYKVYLGDGSQIVPPADVEIAERIAEVARRPVDGIPRGDGGEVLGDEIVDRYVSAVAGLVGADAPRDLVLVHTALHGVGTGVVRQVLERAGFAAAHEVVTQAEPDPDFPTVSFPNPEEPGAMDAALALAAEVGADLVVANDPDADRCAVAVPVPSGPHAPLGWQVLRGDEVGALLGSHVLDRARRSGRPEGAAGTLACSIVSSTLLARMAEAAGRPFAETLTGFKWIGRVPGLAFGYEEALGYCVDPDRVRDKDGISALLLVCELAAGLKAEGRGLRDVLDDLAVAHGLHATDQLSVRVDDPAAITRAVARLRDDPPGVLGGFAVLAVDDLSDGVDGLPATEGLRFRLEDGGRVVVRPSGTEPKLKCYLEVVVPVEAAPPDDEPVQAARIVAAGRLDAIRADLSAAMGLP